MLLPLEGDGECGDGDVVFGAQRGNEAGEGGIGGCHFEAHELTDSGDVVDVVADDGGSVGVD